MKKYEILGLIPARGGSKGIPHKNIILLNDKPLIIYTIEEALKSKYLKKIFVSTDDEKITKVASTKSVEIIKRPKYLARDTTTINKVVNHALKYIAKRFKITFDIIVLLQPTAPLRKANHIDEGIEMLLKYWNKADAVVSLCQFEEPHPFKLKVIRNGYIRSFVNGEEGFKPRQLLPKVYRLNGALYVIKTDILKKHRTLLPKRTLPYFMEDKYSVNIDSEKDIILAEHFLRINSR